VWLHLITSVKLKQYQEWSSYTLVWLHLITSVKLKQYQERSIIHYSVTAPYNKCKIETISGRWIIEQWSIWYVTAYRHCAGFSIFVFYCNLRFQTKILLIDILSCDISHSTWFYWVTLQCSIMHGKSITKIHSNRVALTLIDKTFA